MVDPRVLVDRYELGSRVGQGGAAEVFEAFDRVLRRRVAIKVLRDPQGDGEVVARFRTEAHTSARLNHRALVTLLDAGVDGESPFLVMELVGGPTLRTLIAAGPLRPSDVDAIGAELADALAYVHAQDVIHRDVKPGNVLTTSDGRVKLADFGIAGLLGDRAHQNLTEEVVGTASYLAPEQVLRRPLTPAVDVYALGLLLLEMTTGERAYPGNGPEAALARLNRPPPIPATLRQSRRDLLAAMTSTNPFRRPSARAVARAIRGEAHEARTAGSSTSDGAPRRVPPRPPVGEGRAGGGTGAAAAAPPSPVVVGYSGHEPRP